MTTMRSLITCLSTFLVLLGTGAAAEAAPPGPRAVPVETSFDAGILRQGEPMVHEFVIRNEGGEELRLLQVRAGCGCTLTRHDEVIPPGGTGTVKATVKTDRLKGRVRKTVTVTTNDPQSEKLRLELTAEIRPILDVRPREHVAFGRVPAGERAMRILTLRGEQGRPLELGEPVCGSEFLRAELTALEAGSNGYELRVVLAPDAPVGRLRAGKIEIPTNYPEQPVLALPVSALIQAPEGG